MSLRLHLSKLTQYLSIYASVGPPGPPGAWKHKKSQPDGPELGWKFIIIGGPHLVHFSLGHFCETPKASQALRGGSQYGNFPHGPSMVIFLLGGIWQNGPCRKRPDWDYPNQTFFFINK